MGVFGVLNKIGQFGERIKVLMRREKGSEGGSGLVVETIKSDGIFRFEGRIKFLVSEEIVENNFGGLIERFSGDEGGEFFFETERINVVVEIERLGSGGKLKLGLNLVIDLGGGVGAGENKGSENRETNDESEKRSVKTIDNRFVFKGHGIILTCGI